MFKWLTNLKKHTSISAVSQSTDINDRVLHSVAVLLLEIMHADHEFSSHEKQLILGLLSEHYGLDKNKAADIFLQAEHTLQSPVSLHEHTSLVNTSFVYQQKLDLMNHLWQVAYSDNMLDMYEEHLIRKLADLIYVSHSDFIKQKHAVLDS